jgi:aspartyl/asparaginyl beta-hydroxylase (cupin superfamily)
MMETAKSPSAGYRVISYVGQLFIQFIEIILTVFSKEKQSVIDTATKPWTKEIEENTAVILGELNQLLKDYDSIPNLGDLSHEQKRLISGEQNWKTFLLYTYGLPAKRNISLCPQTDRIIRQIPGMTTAFFSILEPQTSLIPHRGVYKGVLRYHLGLIIPEPIKLCGIKVDGNIYHWAVGKSLIFDDTCIHQAWNNSMEKRVVLFIDFKREYSFPINMLNDFMIRLIQMSPFVANVVKKIEASPHGHPKVVV